MKNMVTVYAREERRQLALSYLAALAGRVSKAHYQVVENEATSGYEFDAVESAMSFANSYGFEIPAALTTRARSLYQSEGCDASTFENLVASQHHNSQ